MERNRLSDLDVDARKCWSASSNEDVDWIHVTQDKTISIAFISFTEYFISLPEVKA
jgi:hypothetical protein